MASGSRAICMAVGSRFVLMIASAACTLRNRKPSISLSLSLSLIFAPLVSVPVNRLALKGSGSVDQGNGKEENA